MNDAPTERAEAGVLVRLRQRKVVQWGVAYAAGAWGLLQGLGYVSGLYDWPKQFQQVALLVLLLGFPIALILAWFHGDRGEQRVSRTEFAIVTLLLVIGGGIFWRYQLAIRPSPDASVVEDAPTPAAATIGAGPSIAVLPFQNRSAERDDAFFVDGIHDDILTQLSKISALKVISRTSVERFRDTKLPLQDVAKQLGVTSILEGGVQRGGDRVRINVQLIDAETDMHLWAETYDRKLTADNIFAIQSELAAAIAGALKAALTPAEKARVDAVPTRNLGAWEAYQLGEQRAAKRTAEALAEAERFYRRAIEFDPSFALAYAGLAKSLSLQIEYSGRRRQATLAEVDAAAVKALAINPDLAEAWAAKAQVAWWSNKPIDAERNLRKAIEVNPNYAFAQHMLGLALRDQGRTQEWLAHAQRAVELDPLSAHYNIMFGEALSAAGRFDEAALSDRRALEIDPTMPLAYCDLALLLAYVQNRFADAVPLAEKAIAVDPADPKWPPGVAVMYLDLDDPTRASQLVAQTIKRWPDDSFSNSVAAMVSETLGDGDAAAKLARLSLAIAPNDSASLVVLRNADLRRGNPELAEARYASAVPDLMRAPNPRVDWSNYPAAIDLARVLQQMRLTVQASALLDRSEQVIRGIPRLGVAGYGVSVVQIYALRGERDKAIAALREAAQAGWRGPFWRYYRDVDPNLAVIRDDPEFKAVFADIERDMARQRAVLAARPKDAATSLGPSSN